MGMSTGVSPDDVAETILWTRRSLLGALGGAAAVGLGATAAYAKDCPNFLDDAPDYIQIVNVKRLGAVGRGAENGYTDKDDTDHIEKALSWARNPTFCSDPKNASGVLHPRAVYFPAGTYLISRPIDIHGCRLFGEPSVVPVDGAAAPAVGGGAIIKAMSKLTSAGEAKSLVPHQTPDGQQYGLIDTTTYKGIPLLHVPRDKRGTGTGPVWIEDLSLDAAGNADHAIYLFGATGRIDTVSLLNARMSNLLCIESAIAIDRVQSHQAGATGIHLVNSSGTVVTNSAVTRYGTAGVANAVGIAVEFDPNEPGGKTTENPSGHLRSGGGLRIRDTRIAAPSPKASGGAGVALRNLITPGVTAGVTVEGVPPAGVGIFLDGCWSQTVENCSIALAGGGSSAAAIELRTGSFGIGAENGPRSAVGCWVRGNWTDPAEPGKHIVVGKGCNQNRFTDNLAGTAGMSVTEAASPSAVPSERNHVTGHGQVINYSSDVPTGTWQAGDIVFNTNPKPGGSVGWVWSDNGFVPFGYIGKDAQINPP